MKKRLLLLVLAVALLMGCLALSALAADTKTAYCEACGQDVTWEAFSGGAISDASTHKHYYLTNGNATTISVQPSVTVCLDLNGQKWNVSGRAFSMGTATDATRSYLNVQDSVGGATVTSSYNGTNATGGLLYADKYSTVSIYGGIFGANASTSFGIGGVVHANNYATINLYGGTINGTTVATRGGAVNLQSLANLHIYGGKITKGNAPQGACVNVQEPNSKLTLSGNAQIDEIYCRYLNKFTIDGAFTGKAYITYDVTRIFNETNISVGANVVIGTLKNNGSIAGADMYCTNGYSVVTDGTNLRLADPASEMRYQCPHCQQIVKWEVFSITAPTAAGEYHFYLDKEYPLGQGKQYNLGSGVQVCLDLQGHTYFSGGRSLSLSGGSTLSIIDSVGGGVVKARSGSNNPQGGTVNISTNATLNLYSGTLDYFHYVAPSGGYGGCGRGAVIYNAGTFNLYGGQVIGREAVDCTYEFTGIEGAGGAIYNIGTLNLQGGQITEGSVPESGAGPCIYMANTTGKVILGKGAQVADICFSGYNTNQLEVNADFTGTANVSYDPAITLLQGTKIGVCAAPALGGTITCGGFTALPDGGNLALSKFPAGTVAAVGDQYFANLQEAVNAATEGAVVELASSCTGDVTIDKSIILQLNSNSIDGTVTVAEGCTLYGMDTGTDDYTVADGKYGKIKTVVGKVAGAAAEGVNYILVTEEDGVSFHCVTLEIYEMVLRVADGTNQPGIYYKSHFKADEKAAPMLATYGIALSVIDAPTAANLEALCAYSVFENFESGPLGNLGNNSSTLLTGILKERYSDAQNLQNLSQNIYGRPYAKTADGQYIFGATVSRTLAEVLTAVDSKVTTLSENQTDAVVKLYNQFENYLSTLELTGIANAAQTQEEGVLKVLILGNSHGLDATNLLYEVFHNEAPQQKVVIGALYYSGCLISQHADFLTENQKVYTYHKNDGSQPNRAWVVKDATCLEALQDEQWDYIFMQQMNNYMALESQYNNDWKVVADYLMNNQDIAPKLGFHMVWANPDDYELYLNDNAPYRNSGNPVGWRNFHENNWKNSTTGKYDMMLQYNDIVNLVQKYLVNDTSLLGRPLDMVLPVGTAIQYAQEVCGRPQEEVYRDYTHVNDYGRLIAAYTWYAEIMGLTELTDVKMDEIPANLKYSASKFPAATAGKYLITQDMKDDLMASVNWALENPFSLPEAE